MNKTYYNYVYSLFRPGLNLGMNGCGTHDISWLMINVTANKIKG